MTKKSVAWDELEEDERNSLAEYECDRCGLRMDEIERWTWEMVHLVIAKQKCPECFYSDDEYAEDEDETLDVTIEACLARMEVVRQVFPDWKPSLVSAEPSP